jgi:glycosyltransferase involved in cell wall biosynthesis
MATSIVYGVLLSDAATDWPGRNRLMLALAARHQPVVLLEQRKHTGMSVWLSFTRPVIDKVGPNLFVMRNAFMLRSSRLGRRLARLSAVLDAQWFHRALGDAGLDDYIYWLTVPDRRLIRGIGSDRLVYDCMDPNFLPAGQAEFDRTEFAIARTARVVFASAQTLYERMREVNAETYLLPNAAPDGPGSTESAGLPTPALLNGRGPVAGYMGTIDWRFDADHVLAAATALPDVTFAMVGRINADQEANIAPLRALPNVVFAGQVDAREGAAYVANFDVGLIPFTPGPMNDAINPVKMFMYLAAGLPVVSTSIAECRANPFVSVADDPQAFADLVRTTLDDENAIEAGARRDFASANTWATRADAAVRILDEQGMLS